MSYVVTCYRKGNCKTEMQCDQCHRRATNERGWVFVKIDTLVCPKCLNEIENLLEK